MNKKKKSIKPKPRVESELLTVDKDAIDAWRIFKIIAEFVDGFELIRKYGKAASFFGTARCDLEDIRYKQATELAGRLVKDGFTVIAGGGPGVMEAANKGAFEAGGNSIGLNIKLPSSQHINPYVTESIDFNYFFSRKVMLAFASEVYIYFPGGFGTLDEFFEMVTLVQTKKIKPIPIVLIGREYWEPLLKWIEDSLYKKYGAIDEDDMELYHLTDSVDEAHKIIIKLVDEYCKEEDC